TFDFQLSTLDPLAHSLRLHLDRTSGLFRPQSVGSPHGKSRTPPYLLVDSPDVLPHDPQTGHRDTENRKEDREEREDSLDLRPHDQTSDEEKEAEGDAAKRHGAPEHPEDLDRNGGEPGHQIEVQTEQPVERVSRLAPLSRGVGDHDLRGLAGEALAESRNEGR